VNALIFQEHYCISNNEKDCGLFKNIVHIHCALRIQFKVSSFFFGAEKLFSRVTNSNRCPLISRLSRQELAMTKLHKYFDETKVCRDYQIPEHKENGDMQAVK